MSAPHSVVWIKGGGDLGSGVAYSLHRVGMHVVITELERPLVIRRAVSFASAVYAGSMTVEGVTAALASTVEEVRALWGADRIPVLADPQAEIAGALSLDVMVDATLAKRPGPMMPEDANITIALGPGFVAGQHAHAVIETMRGHDLGRIITQGSALPDTGAPGSIDGYTWDRLLRAPCPGTFRALVDIGDHVEHGDVVAQVDDHPMRAQIPGVVRGLLWDGLAVKAGQKVGDIDPRDVREHCFTISDKSRAIGRAVLETILILRRASGRTH